MTQRDCPPGRQPTDQYNPSSEADQDLITRAIAQLNGGLSVTIQYPYGDDWAAEDAAVGNFGDDNPGGDVKTPRSSPTTTVG